MTKKQRENGFLYTYLVVAAAEGRAAAVTRAEIDDVLLRWRRWEGTESDLSSHTTLFRTEGSTA